MEIYKVKNRKVRNDRDKDRNFLKPIVLAC